MRMSSRSWIVTAAIAVGLLLWRGFGGLEAPAPPENGSEAERAAPSQPPVANAATPTAQPKATSRCLQQHRDVLRRAAARSSCDQVSDLEGRITRRAVPTQGYCERFKDITDFGVDPTFHTGSCREYCYQVFIANQYCADAGLDTDGAAEP